MARILSVILLSLFLISCSPASTVSGVDVSIFVPPKDGQLNLVRWHSKTIRINLDSAPLREAASHWEIGGIQFEFGKPGMIEYAGLSNIRPEVCGWTEVVYVGKTLRKATIYLNASRVTRDSCGVERTLTHEIGHAIGIMEHTNDGSIMGARLSDTKYIITPALAKVVSQMYSGQPEDNGGDYGPVRIKEVVSH